jgi:hypothetical protein
MLQPQRHQHLLQLNQLQNQLMRLVLAVLVIPKKNQQTMKNQQKMTNHFMMNHLMLV